MAETFQAGFTGGEVSPELYGRVDLERYRQGAKRIRNMIVPAQGPATRRPGTFYLGDARYSSTQARLIPFVRNQELAYQLELGHRVMRFWLNGGLVLAGASPLQISTPWSHTELNDIQFAQDADLMYMTHPNHAPRVLQRFGSANWQLSNHTIALGPFLTINRDDTHTLRASAVTGTITITSNKAFFNVGHVGTFFRLEESNREDVQRWAGNDKYHLTDDFGLLQVRNSRGWVYEYVDHKRNEPTGPIEPIHDEGNVWDSNPRKGYLWKFLHKGYGVAQVTSYLSPTQVRAVVVKEIPRSAFNFPTPYWNEGAFSPYRGYPAAVTFHQQRLFYAGTDYRPVDIFGSASLRNYNDFEGGTEDDNSISIPLADQGVGRIAALKSERVLFAFGRGPGYYLHAETINGALTPSNVVARRLPAVGSGDATPVEIGAALIHMSRNNRRVHELLYSFETDNYQSPDLTVMANHITTPGT